MFLIFGVRDDFFDSTSTRKQLISSTIHSTMRVMTIGPEVSPEVTGRRAPFFSLLGWIQVPSPQHLTLRIVARGNDSSKAHVAGLCYGLEDVSICLSIIIK